MPCPKKHSSKESAIGYGNTIYPSGKRVKTTDMCISRWYGRYIMRAHLNNETLPMAKRYCNFKKSTEGEKIAIMSFIYNTGTSPCVKGKYNWNKAKLYIKDSNGVIMNGLIKRRAEEYRFSKQKSFRK